MRILRKEMQLLWAREAGLTILLCILIAHIFIIIPLGQRTVLGRIIFVAFYIFLLSTGILLFFKNRLVKIIGFILSVLIVIGAILNDPRLEVCDNTLLILYCMMLGWVVLLRTFSAGPVTIHRVFGAIVVYLLAGLIFTLLYQALYLLEGASAFSGLDSGERKEFMYFSLTTLTTTGYGDIHPLLPFSRSLANLEGLIGQLYPAVLIARLVSMEAEASKERKKI
jgi:hypothetical protein